MSNEFFFKIINAYIKSEQPDSYLKFLSQIDNFKSALNKINQSIIGNYIYDKFIFWLSRYFQETKSKQHLRYYFNSERNLNFICYSFINFCYRKKIKLNPIKTLQSFKIHNQLADNAVKRELLKLPNKPHIALLGFGLDDGAYEKELAQFLIAHNICKKVTLYGLDPYAKKGKNIQYITANSLYINSIKFDVIIARWSLHHVKLNERWSNLSACITQCNPKACIIFIEHGFLQKVHSPIEKKIYELLNALFDVIANIGLRPEYLTETTFSFENHFFIHYLESNDFTSICKNSSKDILFQTNYDIGPHFPNQTIYYFQIKK